MGANGCVVIEIKVVSQGDTIARGDHGDFVLDVAIKCNIGYRRNFLGRSYGCRIKGSFLGLVTKMKGSSFVASGENDNEGAEHVLTAWSVLVRFEERSGTSGL
jgi:hypothetical protein